MRKVNIQENKQTRSITQTHGNSTDRHTYIPIRGPSQWQTANIRYLPMKQVTPHRTTCAACNSRAPDCPGGRSRGKREGTSAEKPHEGAARSSALSAFAGGGRPCAKTRAGAADVGCCRGVCAGGPLQHWALIGCARDARCCVVLRCVRGVGCSLLCAGGVGRGACLGLTDVWACFAFPRSPVFPSGMNVRRAIVRPWRCVRFERGGSSAGALGKSTDRSG